MNLYYIEYQHFSGEQFLHVLAETPLEAIHKAVKHNDGKGLHESPEANITLVKQKASEVIL